jgi:hypothetical protein
MQIIQPAIVKFFDAYSGRTAYETSMRESTLRLVILRRFFLQQKWYD